MIRRAALAAGLLAGCFSPTIGDGTLQCGSGVACPPGYHCAADDRCWSDGNEPDFASNADARPPDDLGPGDRGRFDDLVAPGDLGRLDMASSDLAVGTASLVQVGPYCQSTGNCPVMLGAPSTMGDLLVVSCGVAADTVPSFPGPWLLAVLDQNTGANVSIWYLLDTQGGTSGIDVTANGSATVWCVATEWKGLTSLDATGVGNAALSASDSAATSIAANGAVGVSVFSEGTSAAAGVAFTPGAGWTNLATNQNGAIPWHATSDYQLAPPQGKVLTATSMTLTSGSWCGAVATFR